MLRVKAGDLNRMGLLFERYHRELFGFLYHSSSDADTSEDMVQTVFYRMLKYRHTFTGEGAFSSWMYQYWTLKKNSRIGTLRGFLI